MMLTLEVNNVVFSPSTAPSGYAAASSSANGANGNNSISSGGAPEATAALHIAGRVSQEARDVKMGAFHTLDIEANRDIRIIKLSWDSISLARVDEACVEGRGAEVGAIVCGEGASTHASLKCSSDRWDDETGTSAVCLLSEHMTTVRQRIYVPVPRKRMGSSTLHEKVKPHPHHAHTSFLTLSLVISSHLGHGKVLSNSLPVALAASPI